MKFSVITPTMNSEKTVANCILSVNNQTHPYIEHIFIDGFSVDNTLKIIKSLSSRETQLISELDNGIYDAINKGIRMATGDIISVLNSDDQLFDSTVVEQIANIFLTKKIDCVYGNLIYTNENGDILRSWKSKHFKPGLFEKSWTPAHPTFYCKKSLYDKYGLYKTNYLIAADVELMLRFLEVKKVKSFFFNRILVDMRAGGISNRGIKSTIIITKEMIRAFQENGIKLKLIKYLFYKALKIKNFTKYFLLRLFVLLFLTILYFFELLV